MSIGLVRLLAKYGSLYLKDLKAPLSSVIPLLM